MKFMGKLIFNRSEIKLSELQEKMVKNGWGEDAIKKSVVEKITYQSDDLKVNGYLAYPAYIGAKEKYPCIIWNRGGAKESGLIDEFNARGIYGQLASWGYVVFASHYRGNGGSDGRDEFGGSDVNDILNLLKVAEEIPFADTSSWGIEGWSRGGMMTYLTLTKEYKFKAAIVTGGIADLFTVAEKNDSMKRVFHHFISEDNFEDELKKRSVINFIDKLSPATPILIIHGADDERIPPEDSLMISQLLLKHKRKHRFVLLEDADHFLKKQRKEVDRLRKEWFEKYLKKQGEI